MNDKVDIRINDRCNLSDEADYAPVHVRTDGSVICGCGGCAKMRRDDYGCTCPIDYGCNCVEVALHGLCECDAEDDWD